MVHLQEDVFGTLGNSTVMRYTWSTNSGLMLSVITYGAIIQSIKVPSRDGDETSDVVLGFDDLDGYVNRNIPYFGAAIGRYANRIAGANFTIDGKRYNVPKNIGNNALHGGIVGFDKVVWIPTVDGNKVTMTHLSPDGDQGYPGDLVTSITYELTDDGTLTISYKAMSTKKTVINLTNHAYFNLAGHETGPQELYEHFFSINADNITETDSESIPTGKFLPVSGTPYDLRSSKRLADLAQVLPKLYDDNFCINRQGCDELTFVSRAHHPKSGRYVEVHSNQPGVQFYTANSLPAPDEEALVGKDGVEYRKHGAFCFETQNYPDAVHHDNFPSPILSPGRTYEHVAKYRFGVE